MTHRHVLALLLCCMLLLTAGCEQTSIAEQERIQGLATLQAGTPSATATPTATLTPSPTNTPTPTTGPTLTPSATPLPSPTPLPPTPTPNPALANFSLCTKTPETSSGGRFSARLTSITSTIEPAFERVVIGLQVPGESVAPAAIARCVTAANDALQRGDPSAAGSGYALLIDMPGWLHDDLFRASSLTSTTTLSGTSVIKTLAYRYDQNAVAGATLVVALEQPLPFRIELAQNPARLVLEVAKTSAFNESSDMLTVPAGNAPVQPATPLFYIQDGEIWTWQGGQPSNLTRSPEVESALAVSQGSGRIAFCRSAPGADIGDMMALSTLWTMKLDGSAQEELASPGRSCAEPAFSPDGSTIAFTVDETGASPPRLSIYTVPAAGGTAERLSSASDEWSRFGPQWVDNSRMVYAAAAEDGRSTLFIATRNQELDIGAPLVVGDRYRALGRPIVAPNGSAIAVEGLRASKEGADLILLDASGAEQGIVGDQYWVRPVAWGANGTLFYLTAACASEVAQGYTLHARAGSDDRVIAIGTTLAAFGQFSAVGNGLAYVALASPAPGPRGPLMIAPGSPSVLWLWDTASGQRSKAVETKSAITDLAP